MKKSHFEDNKVKQIISVIISQAIAQQQQSDTPDCHVAKQPQIQIFKLKFVIDHLLSQY